MKPIDIYNILVSFRTILEDQDLSIQAKRVIGQEVFNSLPAAMLCAHSPSTLNAVAAVMAGRLKQLEEQENDNRSDTAGRDSTGGSAGSAGSTSSEEAKETTDPSPNPRKTTKKGK